jgi:hypothetical protein
MCPGQFGRDGARLDDGDADIGQELLAQRLRPPVEAPLGRSVHTVPGPRSATGDGGDVHHVTAAAVELVQEDFGGGDRTKQVDLNHASVVLALVGGERSEQHDAGIVDQHVAAAEFLLHAVRGSEEASRSVTSAPIGMAPHCRRSESSARTRVLSRHWSPPVVGPGPNSSYAYQCVAAPAGVSGLKLAAGVSVAVSAEIGYRWPVPCRAGSAQDLRRQMAPRIGVTSPISRTPHPRRRSHRRNQPMTTEFYD